MAGNIETTTVAATEHIEIKIIELTSISDGILLKNKFPLETKIY